MSSPSALALPSRRSPAAQRCRYRAGRRAGFTLIELMVAVAVVAILAMIAIPTYTAQLRKGRRADAEALLMDIAQREQQYLLDTRSYAPDTGSLQVSPPSDVQQYYSIQICQSATAPCTAPGGAPPAFAVIATPLAGTAQASDYTLSIDNTGAKSPPDVW